MKKRVFLFSILILLLIFIISFTISEENDSGSIGVGTSDTGNEQEKIDKAYTCLEDKIKDAGCSKLSTEEKIFSLLAVKKCKTELIDDSNNEECWPSSGCNIKTTAQAILALDKSGGSTSDAEDWLISQNKTPEDVYWYLQIESSEPTTCSITYDSSSNEVYIGSDKKISKGAGSCLSLSEEGYWLRISSNCYDREFEISCDQNFMTSLLYKKKTSSTVYVSDKTNTASAEGTTIEKVSSLCFAKSGSNSCDYEGTLWATIVLKYLGHEVSSYFPYLVSMADESDNEKYIPESFLYHLTNYPDFRTDLLSKQKTSKYWDESGDKFYDTSVALLSLQDEEPVEKSNSKNWLLEIQDKDGCWNSGNKRNTAFILYSLWPKKAALSIDNDCEDDGKGYCISDTQCAEMKGNELTDFDCSSGLDVCCDTKYVLPDCKEQGGKVCSVDEECSVSTVESSDELYCCLGICEEKPTPAINECVENNGNCKERCSDNEEEKTEYNCDSDSLDVCCFEKEPSKLYIWVLIILIILVIIGIIFRNKLRPFWFRVKSKFGGKPRAPPSAGFLGRPVFPPMRPGPRMIPRRILPPQRTQRPQPRTPKPSAELDDVLKKLKEMGK